MVPTSVKGALLAVKKDNHSILPVNIRHYQEEKLSLWLQPDPERGHRDFSKPRGNIFSNHQASGQGCATHCLESQTCSKFFLFLSKHFLIIQCMLQNCACFFSLKVENLRPVKWNLFRAPLLALSHWRLPRWVACGWLTVPTLGTCP